MFTIQSAKHYTDDEINKQSGQSQIADLAPGAHVIMST